MSLPMQPTFFEGPEKKVELVVKADFPSLRSFGEERWRQVIHAAGAAVISELNNDHCDAYLLSESSLFVHDDYVTLITCGRTRIVPAVVEVLRFVPSEAIALLVYERKNEHFPERQATTFYEDAQELCNILPGEAARFGDAHGHCVQMFCTSRPYRPEVGDATLEILMHGIDGQVARRIQADPQREGRGLAEDFGIASLLRGYEISEHIFEPHGYSLNALRGDAYAALHITPEPMGSYLSFETNRVSAGAKADFVSAWVQMFAPRSLDLIEFLPAPTASHPVKIEGYALSDYVSHGFGGYEVSLLQYCRPAQQSRSAYTLDLERIETLKAAQCE